MMTPEEREAFLDEPLEGVEHELYFHRDGTPAKTRREAFAIWDHDDDPDHPDHRFLLRDEFEVKPRRRKISDWFRRMPPERVAVSTVFLVINHAFSSGPPMIFETMVFGGEHNEWQDRYSTEEDARRGHESVVAWVRGERPEPR